MMRVIIFGLMNGVRSSRKLSDAVKYDLRYKFLAEMAEPDFRTIARFRSANEDSIRELFKQTLRLGSVAGLIDLSHVSVDGTRYEANAAKRKYRSDIELDKLIEKADETLQALLDEWKKNDENSDDDDPSPPMPKPIIDAKETKRRLERAKATLAERGSKGIVITDPDSRMVKTGSGIRPGYNAQIVVDSKNQIVVAAEVTQDEADNHQFVPMIEGVNENLGKFPEQTSADGGYWSKKTLEYVEQKDLDVYVAPSGGRPKGLEGWVHDEKKDTYTDPDGNVYTFERQRSKGKGKSKYRIYWCKSTGRRKWIQIGVTDYYQMRCKTTTAEGKKVYKRRKAIVEPVFGHFKVGYGLRRLHLRKLTGAKIEHFLACVTHNIGKIMKFRTNPAYMS
jgi:hypothetical protein